MSDTEVIRELLGILAEHDRFLTSPRSRLRRHTAAAGLARCRALLEGMCILREHGRSDVVGVLARALIEVWLVSLYVLFKGVDDDDDDVLIELGHEHAKHQRILADRFGLGPEIKDEIDNWSSAISSRTDKSGKSIKPRPSFEAIADQLPALLAKSGETFENTATIYQQAYRAESTYSSHPSIGLFVRYIDWDKTEKADRIILNPDTLFDSERLLAALTAFLARCVYKSFGVVISRRLDAAIQKLLVAAPGSNRENGTPPTATSAPAGDP